MNNDVKISEQSMLSVESMILIGATGRNAGKTTLACRLINRFKTQHKIVAVKVTTILQRDEDWHRGEVGCSISSSLEGNFEISEEVDRDSSKDTSRLLVAGAYKVYWLRVLQSHLNEGFKALHYLIDADAMIVCESNRLRHVVSPGLFLITKEKGSSSFKSSAQEVLTYADRFFEFDGLDYNFDINDICIHNKRWIIKNESC